MHKNMKHMQNMKKEGGNASKRKQIILAVKEIAQPASAASAIFSSLPKVVLSHSVTGNVVSRALYHK